MVKLLLSKVALTAALALFVFYLSAGIAAAGTIPVTIEVHISFGITDSDGVTSLQGDGGPASDMVQVIYVGPDGVPNPPGVDGVAYDDVLLELEGMLGQRYTRIGSGFPFNPPNEGKFHGDFRLPDNLSANPKIFIRAWNAPTVADSTHYGDSLPRSIKDVAFGESKNFTPTPAESWSAVTDPPPGVGRDITPPDNVTNFKAVAGDRQVTLSWTNPSGPANVDFKETFIVRGTATYPLTIADGEIEQIVPGILGATQTWTNVRLSNETTYFYTAFARDIAGNFAPGARSRATPQAPLAVPADPAACFIATAAFGTPMAEEIIVLSQFRDRYLLTNRLGRWLVQFYYEHSPQGARYIEKRPVLRAIVRHSLRPLIWSLRLLSSRRINDDNQENILSR